MDELKMAQMQAQAKAREQRTQTAEKLFIVKRLDMVP